MTDVEHSCRICRGEATATQPLLHPCKCRGSIKYIHQDCLLEWLKHSNKSTEKCDICNEPYKFRTIYDPSMPRRIPIALIWSKLLNIVLSTSLKTASFSLYLLCIVIQVPLYWKFAGRIYTWAIDGTLPGENPSFLNALMFGECDILKYLTTNAELSPFDIAKYKFAKFVNYTYLSGIRHIFIAIIIHIALFVEHEYVVRDEGYTKLYFKKVGKEPRQQLVDMLQQVANGMRNDIAGGNNEHEADLRRLEMIANAFDDVREDNIRNRENALRRAIDQGFALNDDNNGDNDQENDNAEVAIDAQEIVDALNGTNIQNPSDEDVAPEQAEQAEQAEPPHPPHPVHLPEPIEQARHVEVDSDEEVPEVEDAVRPQDEDLDAAAEAAAIAAGGNNGGIVEFLEIFGISLNLKTPIFLMFICDFVISAYLFVIYLIPHMLGNLITAITGTIFRLMGFQIMNRIGAVNSLKVLYGDYSYRALAAFGDWKTQHTNPESLLVIFVETSYNSVVHYFVKPAIAIWKNLFIESTSSHILLERIILLAMGYGVISFCIYKLMKSIVAGAKPVLGTPRKIYRVLFEITTTAKVFLIFAIEIFFFPVYCGWLLDFCAAPLLLEKLTKTIDGSRTYVVLFTSYYEILEHPFLKVFVYWALGTLYMLFFAIFVGMIRVKILRPGVLFFIRSPDDPNANLIHDALVKPLMLQLSRIYLSAKVYTAFILIGIGAVTWGLRGFIYLTNSSNDHNVLLPIQIPTASTIVIWFSVASRVSSSLTLLSKYTQKYWTRVFEISCHKLRLSHFILGKPIHQERGYVLYRSFFHSLFKIGVPDFTQPVTHREALNIFKENSDVLAVFVPNGNYVRAPDKDTVSRKFIRKLFVAVTKDDKLIATNEPTTPEKSGYETPTSEEEEESTADDGYTIVYRPPNFKFRCFSLIIMLWLFAVVLILMIVLVAIMLGRPVVSFFLALFDNQYSLLFRTPKGFDWKLIDLGSICFGLSIELFLLYSIDKKLTETENGGGGNEVREQDGQGQRVAGVQRAQEIARNFLVGNVMFMFVVVLSMMLWIVWTVSVHLFCIDYPLRVMQGSFESLTDFAEHLGYSPDTVMITPLTMPLHFVVSLWTMLPFIFYMLPLVGRVNTDLRQLPWRMGLYPVLVNFALLHVPSLAIMAFMHYQEREMLQSIYVWPCSLVVFLIVKSLYSIHQLYGSINDQVKNERYVKGRALENVDIDDDDN